MDLTQHIRRTQLAMQQSHTAGIDGDRALRDGMAWTGVGPLERHSGYADWRTCTGEPCRTVGQLLDALEAELGDPTS